MTYLTKHKLLMVSVLYLATNFAAASAMPKTMVIAEKISKQNFQDYKKFLGYVVTNQGGIISTEISGTVSNVYINPGQKVEKGGALVQIATDRLQLAYELANAKFNQAGASVKAALANLQLAKLALERQSSLKNSPAFSKASFENSQQEVLVANSNLEQAQALEKAAYVDFNLAKLNLEKSTIRAPFKGVISKKSVHPGLYLKTGDPILELQSTQDLEIEVEIPSEFAVGLGPDSKIQIKLQDSSSFSGQIREIVKYINQKTRTIPIRISIDPKNIDQLIINQALDVLIPSSVQASNITIKKDALITNRTGFGVYIIDKNQAIFKPITIGKQINDRVEVLTGLKMGDIVVVRGNERLKPGQAVNYTLE